MYLNVPSCLHTSLHATCCLTCRSQIPPSPLTWTAIPHFPLPPTRTLTLCRFLLDDLWLDDLNAALRDPLASGAAAADVGRLSSVLGCIAAFTVNGAMEALDTRVLVGGQRCVGHRGTPGEDRVDKSGPNQGSHWTRACW